MAISSPSSSPQRRPIPPPPPPPIATTTTTTSPRPRTTPAPMQSNATAGSMSTTKKLANTSSGDNNSNPNSKCNSNNKALHHHLNGKSTPNRPPVSSADSISSTRPSPQLSPDGAFSSESTFVSTFTSASSTVFTTPKGGTSSLSASSSSSPLKAAASLIQTLDKAHSEMTSFAADAARDAEIARKNARKAQEIARRYENRSYPATTKPSSSSSLLLSSSSSASSFGGGPVDFRHAATNGYDHHSGNDSGYRTAGTGFDFVSSSSSTANGTPPTTSTTPTPARPRPPRLRPYHHEENDDDDDDHDISKDEVTTTTGVGVTNRQVPPHEQSQSESQIRTDPLTRTTTNINHRATTTSNAVTPRRPIHTPPSSSVADRIAQHHAEDILQLNQELEKTKSALKAKERAHEECGITLNSLKAKNTSLEEQNHALLFNLEEERKRTSEQVADLQKALDVERKRVLEANEDADLAVDFAKASTEERNQFEHQLQQALEELQLWKERAKQLGVPEGNGIGNGNGNYGNHIVGGDGDGEGDNILEVGTPKRHVHFADQSAFLIAEQQEKKHLLDGEAEGETTLEFDTPRRSSASRPSRSMVAAGRQILRRNTATSPSDTVTLLELTPTKAAELRQRLRQRLVELEEDTTSSSSSTQTRLLLAGSPPTRASRELIHPTTPTVGSTKKKLDECYTAIKILQTSGRKLDLDGYWWRDYQLHVTTTSNNNNSSSSSSNKGSSSIPQSEIQLDAMTRQYCQNVEFKIDRQQKEIKQLESLCGFLEKKLVMDQQD